MLFERIVAVQLEEVKSLGGLFTVPDKADMYKKGTDWFSVGRAKTKQQTSRFGSV